MVFSGVVNWPIVVTETPLNSIVLSLRAIGITHGGAYLELFGFCPPLDTWSLQRSLVEVTSKFRSSHLCWWRLMCDTLIIRHAYCAGG